MSSYLLDAALYYASIGWNVFPVVPGTKIPACNRGLSDATNNEDQIRLWWDLDQKGGKLRGGTISGIPNRYWVSESGDRFFSAYGSNIGIVVGRDSGLVVIDVDLGSGGLNSISKLNLPDTLTATSGSGGKHFYYKHPTTKNISSRNGWRPGVDVKAAGGYVVAPPSTHKKGTLYTWDLGLPPVVDDMAELTTGLISILPYATNFKSKPHVPMSPVLGTGDFPALVEAFQKLGLCDSNPTVLDAGSMKERVVVLCPNRLEHSNNTDGSSTTVIFTHNSGSGILHCSHAHCETKFKADGAFKLLPDDIQSFLIDCKRKSLSSLTSAWREECSNV